MFTKYIPLRVFLCLCNKLGMINIYAQPWGGVLNSSLVSLLFGVFILLGVSISLGVVLILWVVFEIIVLREKSSTLSNLFL